MKPDICDWLRAQQKGGPRETTEIRQKAKEAGYTRGELREAKRLCRIATVNNWSLGHPFADRWFWSLPEDEGC